MKLNEQLDHWAAVRPGHRALVCGDRVLTFAALQERAQELAQQLAADGVRPGDVVAFQLPNVPDAFALYYALIGMGAIVLPLLPALREHDLAYMLAEAGAALMVTLPSWRGVDHEALARRSCSVATRIALFEDGKLRPAGTGTLRAAAPTQRQRPAGGAGDDAVCSMIFTSGTSGRPKAVTYSHRGMAVEGVEMSAVEGLTGDDILFVPPSIAHVSGICFGLYMPMAVGCTTCLLPEWNPQSALRVIERERCTWTAGATPFLQGVVDAGERDPSAVKGLRVFRCGGASVPPALVRRARALGIDAYRSYGMSEHPTLSGRAGQDEEACTHSDGVLHPRVEMIVVDPADPARRLGPGKEGELLVRGPDQALGYLRPEDTSASRFDGWFQTGDLGRLSERRVVTITGRKKDIIIRKGENIAAKELEDLIMEMAAVREVAVVGVPDTERGEMVCCVAVVRPGHALGLAEVCSQLRAAGVSTFKLPERLECIDALPYNPGGKVLKTVLRAMLAGERSDLRGA